MTNQTLKTREKTMFKYRFLITEEMEQYIKNTYSDFNENEETFKGFAMNKMVYESEELGNRRMLSEDDILSMVQTYDLDLLEEFDITNYKRLGYKLEEIKKEYAILREIKEKGSDE